MKKTYIKPDWPVPKPIQAYTTTRQIDPDQLRNAFPALLPAEPIFLNQIHSHIALPARLENKNQPGDASFTHEINTICAIRTADCLPILLCNKNGTHIAAIHAGWRGLAHGIIANTIDALSLPSTNELYAWLGPAISQSCYIVGNDVRDQFIAIDPMTMNAFISAPSPFVQKWLLDLTEIARIQLRQKGVYAIFGGDHCTYSNPDMFFSYRREGKETGRLVTLIWISDSPILN